MDSHQRALRRRRAIAPTEEAVQAARAARQVDRPRATNGRWSMFALIAAFGILSSLAVPGRVDETDSPHSGFEEGEFQYAEPLSVNVELNRYEGTRTAHMTMLLVFSLRRGPADALDLARTSMRDRIHIAEQHAQHWMQDWAKDQDRTGVFETAYSLDGFGPLTEELDRILFPGGEAKLRHLHIASLKFH